MKSEIGNPKGDEINNEHEVLLKQKQKIKREVTKAYNNYLKDDKQAWRDCWRVLSDLALFDLKVLAIECPLSAQRHYTPEFNKDKIQQLENEGKGFWTYYENKDCFISVDCPGWKQYCTECDKAREVYLKKEEKIGAEFFLNVRKVLE
jgi:hypothetical protein